VADDAPGPKAWISEQETAASHLERNLREIDSMCSTGQIAARVQILVCEPIAGKWTDWMDSLLPHCGGQPAKDSNDKFDRSNIEVEERPSPLQVVVVASAETADTCHDLKSGFMEQRMQDLVLAPPFFGDGETKEGTDAPIKRKLSDFDSSTKTTHPDLISSDDHDVYLSAKWSSLITLRSVSAFLQASADMTAAAASPLSQKSGADAAGKITEDETITTLSSGDGPVSPFLIPSFVRVSYVSEENNKVAKWRMHGDFFHPAAWEICRESFDMTFIPHSLSGSGGVNGYCYAGDKDKDDASCGQWWVYMAESQMPTTPEIYADEYRAPLVMGGSNYFWMITETQRRVIVDNKICNAVHPQDSTSSKKENGNVCGEDPQGVMPLGDLESFLINYTPNTALGKKHNQSRRPGYSMEEQFKRDREQVKERKQLKDQEDIEKALFDYNVYPAALLHKDATIKAARSRDAVLRLANGTDKDSTKPSKIKSSYYDVTITKPRAPLLGWCQMMARKGLCSLYAEYLRESNDVRCHEACGLKLDWTPITHEKKKKSE